MSEDERSILSKSSSATSIIHHYNICFEKMQLLKYINSSKNKLFNDVEVELIKMLHEVFDKERLNFYYERYYNIEVNCDSSKTFEDRCIDSFLRGIEEQNPQFKWTMVTSHGDLSILSNNDSSDDESTETYDSEDDYTMYEDMCEQLNN
jgi:hypothetical protein